MERELEFGHPDFPINKINEVLKKAGLEELDTKDFKMERFRLRY